MYNEKHNNLIHSLVRSSANVFFYSLLCGGVQGVDHIPSTGPFLLASNHMSYIDPPALGGPLNRPIYYFARKTLFKPGFSSWALRRLNTIPVDRDGDSDLTAFKRIFSVLNQGQGLLVFPEGTRSSDGLLKLPKKGVGFIACKAQVPIVPARIFGSFKFWNRHQKYPDLNHNIFITYGLPLSPMEYDPGKSHPSRYEESARRIMAAIAHLRFPEFSNI